MYMLIVLHMIDSHPMAPFQNNFKEPPSPGSPPVCYCSVASLLMCHDWDWRFAHRNRLKYITFLMIDTTHARCGIRRLFESCLPNNGTFNFPIPYLTKSMNIKVSLPDFNVYIGYPFFVVENIDCKLMILKIRFSLTKWRN